MARTKLKKPYNPSSKNKRNDALDVDLFSYLSLPALVVAVDGGFFGSLEGIDSFQRAWFFRPETLAGQWRAGDAPRPVWPKADPSD